MLDLGWSEMAIVALVALLILGPKELPNALRTVALWVRKARKLAREFQSGVDELVREAELEEAKKTVQSVGRVNVNREIEKSIDPTGEVSQTLTSDPDASKTGAAPSGGDTPKPAAGNGTAGAVPPPDSVDKPGSVDKPVAVDSPPEPAKEAAETPSSKSA